ncbi:hypothetical protein J3F84DRAFT_293342 [Trichoderma pleuroticola]
MPLPGFFDVWSCPSSRVKKNQVRCYCYCCRRRPGPDVVESREERSRRRTAGAQDIYQSFWGNNKRPKQVNSQQVLSNKEQHRQGPQCHLKKSPRSQISGALPLRRVIFDKPLRFALFEERETQYARPAHAASPAPNGNGGEGRHTPDALLLSFVWSRGGGDAYSHTLLRDMGIGTCGRPWIERERESFHLHGRHAERNCETLLRQRPRCGRAGWEPFGKACPAVDEGGKTCVVLCVSVTSR